MHYEQKTICPNIYNFYCGLPKPGAFIWNDNMRHFTFHANTMPDGSVKGSGVLTYNGGAVNIKFDIDCLFIVDDVTAIMSGVVTYHKENPERVGWECWFKVVDNGEVPTIVIDSLKLHISYNGEQESK